MKYLRLFENKEDDFFKNFDPEKLQDSDNLNTTQYFWRLIDEYFWNILDFISDNFEYIPSDNYVYDNKKIGYTGGDDFVFMFFTHEKIKSVNGKVVLLDDNTIKRIKEEYPLIKDIVPTLTISDKSRRADRVINETEQSMIVDQNKLIDKFIESDQSFYDKIPEDCKSDYLKEKWGHTGDYNFYDSIKEKLLISYEDELFEGKVYDYIKDFIPGKSIEEIKSFIKRFVNKLNDNKKQIVFKLMMPLLITMMSYSQINNMMAETGNKHLIEINKPVSLKNFDSLVQSVGMRESSGRWNISKGQYLGYFQLGLIALEDIGFDIYNYGKNNFLKNKDIQIDCFKKLLNKNRKYMKDYIVKWNNKKIPGISKPITESGILLGAHLIGAKKLKKFFNSNFKYIPKDGNGTSVIEYIEEFSGYDVSKI
jgi:hypothetical protein